MLRPRSSPDRSCFASVRPSTTGSTASRCEGFAVSERWTRSPVAVRWSLEIALVVLHVAGAVGAVVRRHVLELAEHRLEALAHDVREHVQPAAVGHPDHELPHAVSGRLLHHGVEQRDQRLRPFEPEALLPDELRVEEALEELGRADLLEDAQPLVRGEGRLVLGVLHAVQQPLALARVLDVGELDAHVAAISGAEPIEDLAERLDRAAGQVAGEEGTLEVVVAQVVVGGVELGEVLGLGSQRVGGREPVPARAEGVDEPQHARVLLGHLGPGQVRARRLGRGGLGDRSGLRARAARLEEVGPALVDRLRVDRVALADLGDESGVDAEALETGLGLVLLARVGALGACVPHQPRLSRSAAERGI